MTIEIAQKFFKLCGEREATTFAQRAQVMNELIHQENIKILKEQQILEALKENKVLVIKPRRKKRA